MRIALGIEYDGSAFCGWQSQKGVRTVQACVERAAAKVADRPVNVVCAGRTDTGVHALGQVVHFDTDAVRSERSWTLGINSNLPRDVSVTWARQVAEDFHARFEARLRSYRYVILHRHTRTSLLRDRVCWVHAPLALEPMRNAAELLVGEHDFSSFRAVACQAKHPVRTVHRLDVSRSGDFYYIDIQANAFLHHMVRNIAGTLIAVGKGDKSVAWVAEVLAARDRRVGGVTAVPGGLYLAEVQYPSDYAIPAPPAPLAFG